MKNALLAALVGVSAIAFPSIAHAQDAAGAEVFAGVSAGYHDLGVDEDDEDFAGFEINDSSPVIGGFVGADLPLGQRAFAGVEANYHFGTEVIDAEYGASARLGLRAAGGAKFYVRGGYQWINLDPYNIVDVDVPEGSLDDVDDTGGDYLVGVGADFPVGRSALRLNLDTVGFDTVRGTVGFAFGF